MSKNGTRGYNDKYMVWFWIIHPKLHVVIMLELLELLSLEASIYMTIQKLGQVSHILAFMDSSSSLGWIYKSSFNPVKEELHDTVA